MCGIFGVYNPTGRKLFWSDHLIPEMFFHDQIRGRDACGVFGQRNVGDRPDYVKMAGPADEFLGWKDAQDRFFRPAEDMRFIVGHNRAATAGDRGVDGAHPHVVGDIHLVHNGTLTTWPEKTKFKSDSHFITSLLNEEEDFREVQKKLFGAWALVWHDRRDDTLNFVRNSQRPLSFVQTDDDGFWFGSEADMLTWLLKRRNKGIKRVWDLRPNLWVKVLPNHHIKEIAVPFTTHGTTTTKEAESLPPEEYFKTKEAVRAQLTLEHGLEHVKPWEDCKFKTAPVVQQSRPTPSFPSASESNWQRNRERYGYGTSTSQSRVPIPDIPGIRRLHNSGKNEPESSILLLPRSGGGGATKTVFDLQGFMGLTVGDTVHFYPMNSTIAKNDPLKIHIEGTLAVYDETGMIGFVPGVEVSTGLSDEFDNPDEIAADKMAQVFMHEWVYQARITAFSFDSSRRRVRIHARDAEPMMWFNFHDYPGQDAATAKAAWERQFIEGTASEVAAEEKKFVPAEPTFY